MAQPGWAAAARPARVATPEVAAPCSSCPLPQQPAATGRRPSCTASPLRTLQPTAQNRKVASLLGRTASSTVSPHIAAEAMWARCSESSRRLGRRETILMRNKLSPFSSVLDWERSLWPCCSRVPSRLLRKANSSLTRFLFLHGPRFLPANQREMWWQIVPAIYTAQGLCAEVIRESFLNLHVPCPQVRYGLRRYWTAQFPPHLSPELFLTRPETCMARGDSGPTALV